ncbi:MAG TPA: hypothetical protein DCX32_02000 [Candidatus Moranbacteria bacterium]|nr:MAG: hypothetical protein UW87_C0004G0012 [Candidatus Moranbacteria bacterium GW2011_GWC2_45_10]KKT95470.1 MAG: hypothetical protein UW95_C0001G0034 [Parcubacteria group bacterium GW2011_GWC1_45_14]HAV11295.1 hypothetical protein [Candidatus Moranbacteria bacterium]
MQRIKKYMVVWAVSAVLMVVLVFFAYPGSYSVHGNAVKNASLDGENLRVEIVDTAEKMRQGLGGRKGICERCGMLFVFSESGKHSFWMKGMEFPLDILWLRDGKVVAIEGGVSRDSREIFSPDVVSDQVLELNAGMADGLGIGIGSELAL